jgi:hypothetical protein
MDDSDGFLPREGGTPSEEGPWPMALHYRTVTDCWRSNMLSVIKDGFYSSKQYHALPTIVREAAMQPQATHSYLTPES